MVIFSSNDTFWILLFLYYSFGVEKTNTFIRSRGSIENHTRFKTRGELRGGAKAGLVNCLSGASSQTVEKISVDAIILDGVVVIQMLQPKAVSTFEEYFNSVFGPYILRQLEDVKRLDIVWDLYKDDSLKKATRVRRGLGERRKVLPSTRIPSDWKGFLRVDANKDELFSQGACVKPVSKPYHSLCWQNTKFYVLLSRRFRYSFQ